MGGLRSISQLNKSEKHSTSIAFEAQLVYLYNGRRYVLLCSVLVVNAASSDLKCQIRDSSNSPVSPVEMLPAQGEESE